MFLHYKRFHDAVNSSEPFPAPDEPSTFSRRELRFIYVEAATADGVGMTQKGLRRLYNYTLKVERGAGAEHLPFASAFPTVTRFIAEVNKHKRASLAPLGWRKSGISLDDTVYRVLFRDALSCVRDAVLSSRRDELAWGPDQPDAQDPSQGTDLKQQGRGIDAAGQPCTGHPSETQHAEQPRLRDSWDGAMYQEHLRHVHATISRTTRVLGLHIYSDATVVSSRGAVSAYPLRMRIMNNRSKRERWITLAYIPRLLSRFLNTTRGHKEQ